MIDVQQIVEKFSTFESYEIDQLASGNIQDTFLISSGEADQQSDFILQKLNTSIFPNPKLLIENYKQLESHLNDKGRNLIIPRLLPSLNGSLVLFKDSAAWRAQEYIPHSCTLEQVLHPNVAYEGASMVGRFTASFIDLDPSLLHPIIPGFHNLKKYLDEFQQALNIDVANRISSCQKEIDIITGLEAKMMCMFETTRLLPNRVCHCDTKISNILFDADTKKAIKIIDLDTAMPEKVIFDFGDMVRTFLCPVDENEDDLSKITVQTNIFEAMTKGFLFETKDLLTDDEKSELNNGGLLITYEQAVRFLNDYLRNDTYYHTKSEHHNLIRAKNQLRLLEHMFRHETEFKNIVDHYS